MASVTTRVCLVCQREYAKYVCPRCNTPYCTLECYKNHSEACTETFYKENACDELRGMSASKEQRQQMMEALEREHQAEAAELEEMHQGLEELDLDHLSIDQLTPVQRKDFERAVVDGRLGSALSQWEPWWKARGTSEPQGVPLSAELPSLESLLNGKEPAPSLPYHLIELIYSYAYTCRQFNGDWSDDVLGAAQVCTQLSSVLCCQGNPESANSAIAGSLSASHQPDVFVSQSFSSMVLQDVKLICKQPTFVYRVLVELHSLLEQASQQAAKAKKQRRGLVHKLWFFIVWAGSLSLQQLSAIHSEVVSVIHSLNQAYEEGAKPEFDLVIPR